MSGIYNWYNRSKKESFAYTPGPLRNDPRTATRNSRGHTLPIGAEGDEVPEEDTKEEERRGTGWLVLIIFGLLLFLFGVGAFLAIVYGNQNNIVDGQVGPPGPIGPPGDAFVNNSNSSNLIVGNLTVNECVAFAGPNGTESGTICYDETSDCVEIEPALCVTDLSVDGVLNLTGTLTGNFSFNPLHIGDITLEEINGTLFVDGPLGLPILLDMEPIPALPVVPNDTSILTSVLGPNNETLLWLETPNGMCLSGDLLFNDTIHGPFSAPDFPSFPGGIDLAPAGYIRPVSGMPNDLEICAPNGVLHLGCTNESVAIDGTLVADLGLGDDVCIVWQNISGDGLCCDSNTGCVTLDVACYVFDGTNVSFVNGAQVEGDLNIAGNLTVEGDILFSGNMSMVIDDLNVTCNAYVGCNLTVVDTTFTDSLITNHVSTMMSFYVGATASFIVDALANFNNLVLLNANARITPGSVLSIDGAGEIRIQNGGEFSSAAGATATCDSPLFSSASGCVELCPNFTSCFLTIDVVEVVTALRVGQTGIVANNITEFEVATRDDRADHISLFAADIEGGAETTEFLNGEYGRVGSRALNATILTGGIIPGALSCDPFNPNNQPPFGTGCVAYNNIYEMDSMDTQNGRTVISSLFVKRVCPVISAVYAYCDVEFLRRPDFPTNSLIDSATGSILPTPNPFGSTHSIENAAWLDLQSQAGYAELFATNTIDIGNGGRTWNSTLVPPTVTIYGDLVCTGNVTGCGGGGATCPVLPGCDSSFNSVNSTTGGTFGGSTTINNLVCTGTPVGCGAGGGPTCPNFTTCDSEFNSVTSAGPIVGDTLEITNGANITGALTTINNLVCTGTPIGCGAGGGPTCPNFTTCDSVFNSVDTLALTAGMVDVTGPITGDTLNVTIGATINNLICTGTPIGCGAGGGPTCPNFTTCDSVFNSVTSIGPIVGDTVGATNGITGDTLNVTTGATINNLVCTGIPVGCGAGGGPTCPDFSTCDSVFNSVDTGNLDASGLTTFTGNIDVTSGADLTIEGSSILFVDNGGQIILRPGADLNAVSTSNINILDGADIDVQGNGELHFDNLGRFTSDAGAVASCAAPIFTIASGCTEYPPGGGSCPIDPLCDAIFNSVTTDDLDINGQGTLTGNFDVESGANININDGGEIVLQTNGGIRMTAGSTLRVFSTAEIAIETGGDLNVNNGGTLQTNAGSTVNMQGTTTINDLICTGTPSGCGGGGAACPVLPTCDAQLQSLDLSAGGTFGGAFTFEDSAGFAAGATLQIGNAGLLDVTAGGDIVINNLADIIVESGGDMIVEAGGEIIIETGAFINVQSGGDIVLASGADLTVQNTATIALASGGAVEVNSGGDINVNSGGDINVLSTGCIRVDSGGDIDVLSGGDINVASGGDIILSSGALLQTNAGSTVNMAGTTTINDLICTGTPSGCGGGGPPCPVLPTCDATFQSVTTDDITVIAGSAVAIGATSSWTQDTGGSFTQNSPATFTNIVDFDSTTTITSGGALLIAGGASLTTDVAGVSTFGGIVNLDLLTQVNTGALLRIKSGAVFNIEATGKITTAANAVAECADTIFDDASGCVDPCLDTSGCDSTFNSLTVDTTTTLNGNVDINGDTNTISGVLICDGNSRGCTPGDSQRRVISSGGSTLLAVTGSRPMDYDMVDAAIVPNTLPIIYAAGVYTMPYAGRYSVTISYEVQAVDDFFAYTGTFVVIMNRATQSKPIHTCLHTGDELFQASTGDRVSFVCSYSDYFVMGETFTLDLRFIIGSNIQWNREGDQSTLTISFIS